MQNDTSKNYNNYRNIRVISDDHSSAEMLSNLLNVNINYIVSANRNDYLHNSNVSQRADLVVIDMDSLGITDTSYLCFIATCFRPATPVALVTSNKLSRNERDYFLSAGAYDIIPVSASTSLNVTIH